MRSSTADLPPRPGSLRREWSRAIGIMVALLVLAAALAIVGVAGVVDDVAGTARQLRRESALTTVLRTDIINHEEVGHELLSGHRVDLSAYVAAEKEIGRRFAEAAALFPPANNMRATVLQAARSWQAGLTTYGLWSSEVGSLHGDHQLENPIYGASSDGTVSIVDRLQAPSLLALDGGLAHGRDLERALLLTLVGLFGLALLILGYFRRKMVRDLLQPVANMRLGVSRLQAGQYDHHIAVARRDELGELTEAFNRMAGALHDSHLALTLRATHDSLTGLANRASLTERLVASFAPGHDRRSLQESLLFIDVDDFKVINDSLGHECGDALLTQLAARLRCSVRTSDLVARLGGDEFAVVVAHDDGGGTATATAERILAELAAPFTIGATSHSVSVSIGVAQRRPETVDAAELLRRADFAMYMAKGSGKGRYQLFDAQVHDKMVARAALKTDLASAASNGELRLFYQAVVDVDTGEMLGVEALLRWQHPTLGLLAPSDFVGLAEETGDIASLGAWALETATAQVAEWRAAHEQCNGLWVSVNVSRYQLSDPKALADVERIARAVAPEHLVLEITETALAGESDSGRGSLEELRRCGVRVAVDDFGTGLSTLSTLATLPVDILKIDRSFISGTAAAPSGSLLEGIVELAGKLSLEVIAEGIETPEQLGTVQRLGCQMGQGFLLGRPLPADGLASRLALGALVELPTGVLAGGGGPR